jgi:SAM-dependent methyltransferase
MRRLWNILGLRSKFGYIAHLQPGQKWDPAEFHLTGIRFVDRMVERFADYGALEPSQTDVLEIGCGIGRFLRPLACRFRSVCGIDISRIMLFRARRYCAGLPNVTLQLGDGKSLSPLKDGSFDYCVCAGVFHHITEAEVVLSYIREALRVLKPGGLFLFQFEGSKTETVGAGQRGAKITARRLTEGLADRDFAIREISMDSKDAIKNVVIVLEKLRKGENRGGDSRSFQAFKAIDRRWISGVYDDIRTQTSMHARQKQPPLRLTFYDE